eukprot:scaffold3107_cov73-Phaeocystis_antarctica.AAC.2
MHNSAPGRWVEAVRVRAGQSACDRPTHLHGCADEAWPIALDVALRRLLVPLVHRLQLAQGQHCSAGARCVRLTNTSGHLTSACPYGVLGLVAGSDSRARPKPDPRSP